MICSKIRATRPCGYYDLYKYPEKAYFIAISYNFAALFYLYGVPDKGGTF